MSQILRALWPLKMAEVRAYENAKLDGTWQNLLPDNTSNDTALQMAIKDIANIIVYAIYEHKTQILLYVGLGDYIALDDDLIKGQPSLAKALEIISNLGLQPQPKPQQILWWTEKKARRYVIDLPEHSSLEDETTQP